MNKIRSGEDKGDWRFPHVLKGPRKYWVEDPKFLQKSATGKQNRAKDPTAPRYTDGSRSIPSHFNKLKQKFQRHPTEYEVMKVTKKTKIGVWVNEKSAGVADAFHRLREEADSQGQKHSAASDNALFLKAAGGKNKKGYVYGLGPMGDDFVASSTLHIQSKPCPSVDCREVILNLNRELAAKDLQILTMRTELTHQGTRIDELYQMMRASGSGSSSGRDMHDDTNDHEDVDDEDANDDLSPLP